MKTLLSIMLTLCLTATAHAAYEPPEWSNTIAITSAWAEFAQLKATTGKSWVELTTINGMEWVGGNSLLHPGQAPSGPIPYLSIERVTEFYETGTLDDASDLGRYMIHAYGPPSISTIGQGYVELRFPFHLADGSRSDVWLWSRQSLAPTPLPPAVWLFGAGLLTLIGLSAWSWRITWRHAS